MLPRTIRIAKRQARRLSWVSLVTLACTLLQTASVIAHGGALR